MVAALNSVLILFSALSFLGYGVACFLPAYMNREFERYRLASQRSAPSPIDAGCATRWIQTAAMSATARLTF